ncbi:MAG: zinc ribbon domain-containing protein [Halobacteriales archaeon]|nr:zinc ribbon domain-containing protein [Halobacteriales archaeon]
MIVRYYGDAERRDWHGHMVSLLERIHDDHGIPVEIDRVEARHGTIDDFPGAINHPTAEAVYERDLKNNRVLIENIDERPSEAYKRSGDLDVAGHVAIVNDGVHWASTLTGDAYGYGPGASSKTAIDFLEDVADSPSDRVCVECLELLDGEGNYCPNCGCTLG